MGNSLSRLISWHVPLKLPGYVILKYFKRKRSASHCDRLELTTVYFLLVIPFCLGFGH